VGGKGRRATGAIAVAEHGMCPATLLCAWAHVCVCARSVWSRAAATCSRQPVCAPAPARARSPCVATRARHQSRVPLAWPGGISLALTFHLKVAYLAGRPAAVNRHRHARPSRGLSLARSLDLRVSLSGCWVNMGGLLFFTWTPLFAAVLVGHVLNEYAFGVLVWRRCLGMG
jgi:hypothetical protein